MTTHTCEECGCRFTAIQQERRFCSRDCANKQRGRGARLTGWYECERCGCQVVALARLARRYRFCATCRPIVLGDLTRERRPRQYRNCVVCGTPFYAPPSLADRRYCSQACAAQRRRDVAQVRKPTRTPGRTVYMHGFRPDLGHYVRSRWEANVARLLRVAGLAYEYEPSVFILTDDDGSFSYRPDFLVESRWWVEVKGRWQERDKRRVDAFRVHHDLIVVDTAAYNRLARLYGQTVVGWERNGDPAPGSTPMSCETCGRPVMSRKLGARFCSRQCSNVRYRHEIELRVCEGCGKELTHLQSRSGYRFCSRECHHANMRRS